MKAFLLLLSCAALFGCCGTVPYGPDENSAPSGVPESCGGLADCALFECMVDSCWCKDAPGGGVLARLGKQISSAEDAEIEVYAYLEAKGAAPASINAVKINSRFYNVFYEMDGQGERHLTVSADGTLMETECGV